EIAVRGGRAEFREVTEAIEMSEPRFGVVRDHPLDLAIGVLGVLAQLVALEPGELNVAEKTGRIVRDRLAVSVCSRLEIRLQEQALALEFLELGELERGVRYIIALLEVLGGTAEQNLEMALGVGGSFRTELEGQIHAASFQCGVVGV